MFVQATVLFFIGIAFYSPFVCKRVQLGVSEGVTQKGSTVSSAFDSIVSSVLNVQNITIFELRM